ncbi:flagellar basal body rod protein FlgG [Halalkalibacillus halophilus]|uniref:flagellar basal body rod protein FlgG n=1 Tax=Halalkalibacillus halophilus TaxID=392827 RepID=UPI00040CFE32|nr:flagellar basal body rod protein FlgG [Halalkalibacillus halophilus]
MLRSMYTGISGMSGFQNKLDTVSNNIANVNTFGFKKGRTTFSDLMSQTSQGAAAPANGLGGRNPMQTGLGTSVGSIDNIHTQGNVQTTNRPLDLAIEGDGMFKVAEEGGGNPQYTRAGNFYLDEAGDIVNSSGYYLMGDGGVANITIPDDAQSFDISPTGIVNYVDEDGAVQEAGQVTVTQFSNPEGLEKAGGNMFLASNNSGEAVDTTPGADGSGELYTGALEMSNVDLAEEFTEMITSQRGFQANTRVITTSDEILQELVNLKR